jgi:hypothetical protein
MKHAVFWDVTPCGYCKNRRFGGTSVLTRATRHNIPKDGKDGRGALSWKGHLIDKQIQLVLMTVHNTQNH